MRLGNKVMPSHGEDVAKAVKTMTDWLARHYHEREANLERDPVAVYAQAQFEPDDIHCYQQLVDWTAANAEVVEVFPEYAAAYDGLLTACKAAMEWLGRGRLVGTSSRPLVDQLVAAIAKARGPGAGGE